ncbi:MAG TPA: phosphonoacetaldehyde reductase [Jiangellaceae bacterium]
MPANTAAELRRDHRVNAAAPVVAYGDRSVLRVPGHLRALGATRVLLVCGRTSFEASGAVGMLPELESIATVRRWSDFVPNTDSADLRTGLRIMREFEPDAVIGVGGGSALDMAKLLCGFRPVADEDLLDGIRTSVKTVARNEHLVLVPTTSGSGAEATHFAVVYIGNEKYSIGGGAMRPDVIALDPTLAVTGSPYQRATSGIDAVCQAIESLWAVSATDRSRHFARTALRVLMPAIEGFVNDPDPISARAMCIGSHYAGRAIDISRTTAAHALSYGLTKQYGLSHGHAVALTLPAFIAAHENPQSSQLQPHVTPAGHDRAMHAIVSALDASTATQASTRFRELARTLQLTAPETAPPGHIADQLIATVNAERLANNPVRFTPAELRRLVSESLAEQTP